MKRKIKDISFVDYISLSDRSEYDYYLRYAELKPLDFFNLGDITNQSFGFVKDMQEHLNYGGLTWQIYFDEMTKHGYVIDPKLSLFTLHQSRIYLKNSIEFINKLESDGLGHATSADEEAAGIEVFSKYRSFIQMDRLAGGDVTKYEDVRKQNYGVCFTKLKLDSDRSEYESRLHKIRTKNK